MNANPVPAAYVVVNPDNGERGAWVPPTIVRHPYTLLFEALARALIGTCDPLSRHASEAERADPYFTGQLDAHARQCANCGLWCPPLALDSSDECHLCTKEE
jgi:hypothetical protein